MRRWHRLVLALYRIDLLLRIGYRRSSTTRASKTVRQLAPSDGEVAVVTPPSPQLPPSMVRLTALVIRSRVICRGHAMAAVARRPMPVNAARDEHCG